jgi:hypothetical protein
MRYYILHADMSEAVSRLRQQLWLVYRAQARTLRALQGEAPMVQGSLYLLRRKCGKPNCRCTRGQLHASWVLTRSQAGKSRLYPVPADQRGGLRPLTREYRRWQRTRALLIKQSARLVGLIDQLAEHRLQTWPPPKTDGAGTG